MTPDFDSPDLQNEIEALGEIDLHELPYGVIKLNRAGVVTFYSRTEARQSGRKARPTVGLDFFTQVAPCMDTPEMRGRIAGAQAAGTLDLEIGWVGDFDDPDAAMRIRALSASDGGLWLLLDRESV